MFTLERKYGHLPWTLANEVCPHHSILWMCESWTNWNKNKPSNAAWAMTALGSEYSPVGWQGREDERDSTVPAPQNPEQKVGSDTLVGSTFIPASSVKTREAGSRELMANLASSTLNLQMWKLRLKTRKWQQMSSKARGGIRHSMSLSYSSFHYTGDSSLAEDRREVQWLMWCSAMLRVRNPFP